MALYGIFSFLDGAIYSMASFVVKLIIIIANYDFFKTEIINEVVEKVYVALGVLVLFKIVITCIQYMINPDTFDDKEKGMAGLLKKAAISMGLLVLVQPVFNFAMSMQTVIVSTIPGLIMGDGSGENYRLDDPNNASSAKEKLEKIGDMVAGSTVWTFVTYKEQYKNEKRENIRYIPGTGAVKEEGNNTEVISGTVQGFRENITKGCDGSIWALFDTNRCIFDYRVGISTAAGLFLLYVLVSLSFDVGIRAIKLGILQMLAPIPIGSYIVSKDKLNKFVKLATNVYIDLFIRLGVVYFIVYFVNKVISTLDSDIVIADGNYIPDDLEKAFVKVIVIIALFMFAKKAPQFICDVLGIENKGMGDMAEMFKPGRLAGLAAGAINPIRNAASNVRDAWKNNADMVDNRGGKIRRAIQHTRRGINAARYGVGGLTRGAFDAYAGTINGEDWAKRNQRLQKSISKSKKSTAEGFMKRTDNDKRQEFKDQRKAIEKEFKAQGIDINAATKKARKDAIAKVNGQIKGSQVKMDYIKRKLASGEGTSAERIAWANELKAEQARYNSLTSKDGYEKAVAAEMKTSMDQTLAMAYETKRQSAKEKEASNIERMAMLRSELNDPSLQLSESERNKKADEWMRLSQENAEINAKYPSEQAALDARKKIEKNAELMLSLREELGENYYKKQEFDSLSSQKADLEKRKAEFEDKKSKFGLSASEAEGYAKILSDITTIDTQISSLGYDKTKDAEVTKLMQRYNAMEQENISLTEIETNYRVAEQAARKELTDQYDEQVRIKTNRLDKERDISGWTIAKGKADAFFGGEGFTGKGYLDTADLLKNNRSSLYTGEAMTKMRQNADILVDASGQPATFKAKFTMPGVTTKISYADMADLKRKADNGTLSRAELDRFGFENSAMVQSAFEDIEKQAAEAYVTANMAAADPSVHSDIKLKGNAPANTTIVEGIKRMKASLASANIPPEERKKLLEELSKNPGSFFKSASDRQEKMRTKGSRISAYNSGKKDSGS